MEQGGVLQIRDLELRFGTFVLADRINLAIPQGAAVGLIGPNGSGKTTMLNVITAWQKYSAGQVRVQGREVSTLNPVRVARLGVRRSFQAGRVLEGRVLTEQMALSQIGPSALRWETLFGNGVLTQKTSDARSYLESLGEAETMSRVPLSQSLEKLSGGFRRLADTLSCLYGSSVLAVLDEPFSGLAHDLRQLVATGMQAAVRRGTSLLVVDHDVDFLAKVTDSTYRFLSTPSGKFKLERSR